MLENWCRHTKIFVPTCHSEVEIALIQIFDAGILEGVEHSKTKQRAQIREIWDLCQDGFRIAEATEQALICGAGINYIKAILRNKPDPQLKLQQPKNISQQPSTPALNEAGEVEWS